MVTIIETTIQRQKFSRWQYAVFVLQKKKFPKNQNPGIWPHWVAYSVLKFDFEYIAQIFAQNDYFLSQVSSLFSFELE